MEDLRPAADPSTTDRGQDATSTSVSLLIRARAGDEQALDQLLCRYLPRLKRWITGRLPGQCRRLCDTDDLVQETIIRVLRALPSFEVRHDAALQAYLRQSVWNRLREEIRRSPEASPFVELDESQPATTPSPLEQVIGRAALARYELALQELDPDQRSAVIARLEFGYSYPELARMLGKKTPDAARKIVERAVSRLAHRMSTDAT
jgi:RNA polymerase sigma factor (sigma-70 family)